MKRNNTWTKANLRPAIAFAKSGKTAIICALDEADLALRGKAGTQISVYN